MISQQRFLTRFIAPVFLLQTLIQQLEASTQSSTTPSSQSLPTVSCDSLLDPRTHSKHSTVVQQRLRMDSELVNKRQCIILSTNPAENLNELIERIPENTVILLSSEVVMPTTPSPSVSSLHTTTPAPVVTPGEYFVNSAIRLKNGQDIIGAAENGFEIMIKDRPGYEDKYVVRIGTTDNFQADETKNSNIKHVNFQPDRENNHPSIDSIVFAECYNRKLILEGNIFHLPIRAAVVLDCRKSLDASANGEIRGPGLQFSVNLITGEKYNTINNHYFPHLIPDHGIFINLPEIRNQSEQLVVKSNSFTGNMAEAGEFRIAPGSSMDIISNEVNISNAGFTRRDPARKGGFVLTGDIEGSEIIEAGLPRFYMIENHISVTWTAITIWGGLELNLICNHLQAVNPWWQPLKPFSLKAVHKSLEDLSEQKLAEHKVRELCERPLSSSILMSTPTPHTNNPMVNTWTATNGSSACRGLFNLEGELFFDTEICQPVAPPYDSGASSNPGTKIAQDKSALNSSSARATAVIFAFNATAIFVLDAVIIVTLDFAVCLTGILAL
ncbi:hypothetical protein [Endozoicomonas sp. 2B-B]